MQVLITREAEPPPPIYYLLNIGAEADLVNIAVPFKLNNVAESTPYSQELVEGSYVIEMPSQITLDLDTYSFKQWSDGDIIPVKTVNLIEDANLTASYQLQVTPPPPPPEDYSKLIIPAVVSAGAVAVMAYAATKKSRSRRKN